ncbi:MAG: preprotein translocase subunit SecG, partial [Alphaproteobacteria bacterium]|nr:preprotein translocase subunit SecG [Alphaproteobacteria bacterium]
MTAVILVIHVLIAIALVVTVLLQRSDGGALGGLGGGSFGGVMSGRQSANLLTRTTGILAACFMGTSMLLAIMA